MAPTHLGLNPCYNGMTIESVAKDEEIDGVGLNPCYNGMTIE